MKIRNLMAFAVAALVAFGSGCAVSGEKQEGMSAEKQEAKSDDNRYGKQKVVYHINYDNPKAQAGALRNIGNHIRAVGAENLDVKVVLHGKGVSLLLDPNAKTKLKQANGTQEMTAKVATLKDQGVAFNICANTLKGKKINWESDLYDVQKSDIVPSGVAELSRLQMLGYTYIKP